MAAAARRPSPNRQSDLHSAGGPGDRDSIAQGDRASDPYYNPGPTTDSFYGSGRRDTFASNQDETRVMENDEQQPGGQRRNTASIAGSGPMSNTAIRHGSSDSDGDMMMDDMYPGAQGNSAPQYERSSAFNGTGPNDRGSTESLPYPNRARSSGAPGNAMSGSYPDRSGATTPTYTDYSAHGTTTNTFGTNTTGMNNSSNGTGTTENGFSNGAGGGREPYPAWTVDHAIPLSKEEIEDIFIDLANKFGFQRDSVRNMYDHFMILLDSRSSRMSAAQALLSLHADYIGGVNANFRKWYFAAELDLDDAIGEEQYPGISVVADAGAVVAQGIKRTITRGEDRRHAYTKPTSHKQSLKGLNKAADRWRETMESLSAYDRVRQVALYLLCWGEAAQVRFVPECLCFIFKCADDYYRSDECQSKVDSVPEGLYLTSVIKPLYRFIRDQGYEIVDGKYVKRERDHDEVIGYDDVNQLFWSQDGINRIVLSDKSRLTDYAPSQRFMKFGQIEWSKVFYKTYLEKRSMMHFVVNFNRVWIIHIAMYWYYTAYNAPTIYKRSNEAAPTAAMTWSAVALGGAVATIIMIIATITEFCYIPTTWSNTVLLTRRMVFLAVCLAITIGPTIYIAAVNRTTEGARILGIVQFVLSVIITLFLAIIPSGRLLGDKVGSSKRKYLANQTFTASYPRLAPGFRMVSILMWVLVFGCKFVESYFFLTLSFRDPIRVLANVTVDGCSDTLFGSGLCENQPAFALTIMFVMDLVLFFLDTFLWYVIWNTIFSITRSFYLGLSVWTPWKSIYSRLPKRIYGKILATSMQEIKYKPKVLVSQIWNAIIISMYREHLLSMEHVQKMLYHQVASDEGKRTLQAPNFFLSQDEQGLRSEFFPHNSEAERRISFFAQSLSTSIPEPLPIDAMPTFTVLVPHYAEKILLSLREIIREEDQNTRVTLLEYLKQLHPVEWDNFVKDTKILAEETSVFPNGGTFPFSDAGSEKGSNRKTIEDLPFYCIGFKSAAPEYTLRTRIWASLRAQTLYRTVSGFMNYSKAIKLLYRVENPDVVQLFGGDTEKLEKELERMARRKFKFVISMQRYSKFNKEEQENAEFLLRAYPDLQIAYLDEEAPRKDGDEPRIFSALIDGHSEILPDGRRRPKFRIQLPGNPILGDGKSDNQNHAIIFQRGEYVQLIDANQDNYLEECLKIRNILGEFEEYHVSAASPYGPEAKGKRPPVAIVGAREYIFSENIGVLGDIAAGKEQTFGTLAARNLAQIGGKLHYGHPDFLNAVFMNTRGGVSKAQKGLHLNEDIYAGMNAYGRGGRIKHTEYFQCGKGRDMGFGTILNFITKIGTGMGEQMLSREYYYMGTQLPLDRFLTFYYGHPGFHINNILIITSVQLFMFALAFLGSLNEVLLVCDSGTYDGGVLSPVGCYNILPVFAWIKRCILSIFIVFFIAFFPLFLQELTERGLFRAVIRLGKQFLSLSPIFEVFTTQIYTHSILSNLTFGGARYIATGRGFATARISFSILYSRFAGPSIYLGMRTLALLLFVTLSIWTPYLIWFWISVVGLCIAPFIFNPHQFSMAAFLIDYRELLRWFSRGNSRSHANSWIAFARLSRTRIVGLKRKRLGHPSEKLSGDVPRASLTVLTISEFLFPWAQAIILFVNYSFIKSFNAPRIDTLLRVAIITLGPIALDAAVLFIFFFVSLFVGPCFRGSTRFGAWLAAITHGVSVVGLLGFFEFFWYLEAWNASHCLAGILAIAAAQRAIYKTLIALFLTREFKHDESNRAWWTGKWSSRTFGNSAFSQPLREFVCKLVECGLFAADFILCHLLLFALFPITLIPGIGRLHSTMLFWLRPDGAQIRSPIYSLKQRARRRRIVVSYGILFALMYAVGIIAVVLPLVVGRRMNPMPLTGI